jgi:hypothetical protein
LAPTASPTPPVPFELVPEAKLPTSKGGAVACTSSKVEVVNTVISGNSAGLGGGFFVEFSNVIMRRSLLDGNSAFLRDGNGGLGGAIYSIGDSVPLTIVDTKLANNEASGGGAVYLVFSKADMKRSACDNNTALTGGGCFLVSGGAASVAIADSTFYANDAEDGAGILFVGSAASEVVNCDFIANHALRNGGGIKTEGVLKLAIINLAFQENIADNGGGGIFWDLSIPNIKGINASATFNNSAGYGPVYASIAKHLVWTKQLTLGDVVASAVPFNSTLTAEVRDYYMQRLATDSRSSVSIEFPEGEKLGKLPPALIGLGVEVLKDGVATFVATTIRKKPDNPSSIYLEVNVDDNVIRSRTLDLYFRQCLAGEYEDVTNLLCVDCPKGTITTNDSLTMCTPCAPGTIAKDKGMSTCESCVSGTFAIYEGLAVCSPCSITTFQPFSGSDECMACPGFSSSILPDNHTNPAIHSNGMKCFCDRGFYSLEQTISMKLGNAVLSREPAGFTCETCVAGGLCANRGTTRLSMTSLPGYTPGRDGSMLKFAACDTPENCIGGAGCLTRGSVTSDARINFFYGELTSNDTESATNATYYAYEVCEEIGTSCVSGYGGLTCGQCLDNFGVNLGSCQQCPTPEWNGLKMLLIGTIFGCGATYLTYKTVAGALLDDTTSSVVTKIFMSGLQFSSISVDFEMSWPQVVASLLQFYQEAMDWGSSLLSIDCLVPVADGGSVFVAKTQLIIVAMPFFVLFVPALVFIPYWMRKRALYINDAVMWKKIKLRVWDLYVSSCWVLLFLVYPTITGQTFKLFDCVTIGLGKENEATLAMLHQGETGIYETHFYQYLRDDPSIACGTKEHLQLQLIFGTFGFFWVVSRRLHKHTYTHSKTHTHTCTLTQTCTHTRRHARTHAHMHNGT